jgi:hypothetical protein
MIVSMPTRRNQGYAKLWLALRSLISAAAIYALVMQPLLLTIAGGQLAQASALDEVAFAQLCLHNTDASPVGPGDQTKHPAHQHCLQCFSGAFVLLDAARPITIASAHRDFRKLRQSVREMRFPSASRYSGASPRGPP